MADSQLELIFDAALQKETEAERAAYLEGACGNNMALRERVDTLLRAHAAAGSFLKSSPLTDEEGPGTAIGRYKLLQKIGEGGFGVVYMAEQLEPVRRKVALKIIKLGMDTRQVVARFESERQALALMDHANIARVFDAGATESGRPYFVMELVRGVPITDYADRNALSLRERLELFVTVCRAVQHAHQKGVIHRDIKPTNVLVTLHDGVPVPKVIDFGIAKATNQRLTEKTVFTEFRQIVGTPQYMSPEQAEMSGLDVDTRCDIYSLGVMLYELLTGTTPLEAERLRTLGYSELQKVIREEDPPRPSLRVSTLHEQLDTMAKNRRTEPRRLPRLFRGDLDWIVLKSLEKDRTRRYSTANDLAADVERYLNYEPIQAGPPGVWYSLRKFARRNRRGVAAASLIVLSLLIGLGVAAAGWLRAGREADRSREIAGFLEEIVLTVNPAEADGGRIDVERVTERARTLFGSEHATVAAALDRLGTQAQNGGDFKAAERLFRESDATWRALSSNGHNEANRAHTLSHLGALQRLMGDETAAEASYRESLEIADRLPPGMQLEFCDARVELSSILQRQGQSEEVEKLLRRVLALRRTQASSQPMRIAQALEQLIPILVSSGRIDEADQAFAEAIEIYRTLFPGDSATVAFHNAAYGHWLRQHGRFEKAEPYYREAIRVYRQMENPPREYYLLSLDGLFQLIRRREDAMDETIAVFHECMLNMGRVLGADNPVIAPHLLGFAYLLGEAQRWTESIPLLVDGIRIQRKARGDEWNAKQTLATLERSVRKLVIVAGLPPKSYETALDGAGALLSEQPANVDYHALRGMALYRLERFDEALVEFDRDDSDDETSERSLERLAFLALARRQSGAAEPARQALEKLRSLVARQSSAPAGEFGAILAEVESTMNQAPPN